MTRRSDRARAGLTDAELRLIERTAAAVWPYLATANAHTLDHLVDAALEQGRAKIDRQQRFLALFRPPEQQA